MDRSEVGGFLIEFCIYILVFVICLFATSRIKDVQSRAITSGLLSFALMAGPLLLILPISLALSGISIEAIAFVLGVFVIQAAVSAFYAFSLFKGYRKLTILALITVFLATFGLVYFLFFQRFDWRLTDYNTDVTWEKAIDEATGVSGKCIVETPEGDYLIAADRWDEENLSDIWLLRIDAAGKTIWDKTYGGKEDDNASRIILAADGGYVLMGNTKSYGAGGEDVWLLKVDSIGNLQWNRTFGYAHDDSGEDIELLADGGYIIAGNSQGSDGETLGAWVIKTDADGNEEWSKSYRLDDERWYEAVDIKATPDNGYIVVGNAWYPEYSRSNSPDSMWVRKIDDAGRELWYKEFIESNRDVQAFGIDIGDDGDYLILGEIIGQGGEYLWSIQTSPSGEELWSKKFGFQSGNKLNSCTFTENGNILVSGRNHVPWEKGNNRSAEDNIVVFEIDVEGHYIWQKTFDKRIYDNGLYCVPTSDGYHMLIGDIAHQIRSFSDRGNDIWVVKFTRPAEEASSQDN